MSNLIGDQAVVIGAGIGGLTAAAALSDFFVSVIVLDRDDPPLQTIPRAGVPQGRHAHGLLAGGQQALEHLFPGFADDLVAAGAIRYNAGLEARIEQPGYDPFPQRDLGLITYTMSRPLLERVVRLHVAQRANVRLRANCSVREIIATADGTAVKAVRCEPGDGHSETVAADLVVDASGRGALTLAFLETYGYSLPRQISIGADIRYASAVFAAPGKLPGDCKVVLVFPDPRINSHGAIMFPIEGGRWILTLAEAHGDGPPADADGFLTFARQLRTPTVYDAIRDADRVGEIARFAFPSSVRRQFDPVQTFPRGLLPMADAICRFNPVFGQGMTVAAQEACTLQQLLRMMVGQDGPIARLAPAFFSAIDTVIDTPWAAAVFDLIHPQTPGERPPDLEASMKFQAALNRLAARDPSIHKTVVEVRHLIKPHSALREPALMQRVVAEMEAMSGMRKTSLTPVSPDAGID